MADELNAMMFLALPKLTLNFFGVWMLPTRNNLYKNYNICILILICSFLVFNLIHMVTVWGDIDIMSKGSYLLFTHVSTCYKTLNFVIRTSTFKELLKTMDSEIFLSKSQKHDEILLMHSNRIRKMYTILAVATLCNCIQWAIVPLLDKTQRLLLFDVWMPMNVQVSPNYEIGYIYQVLMILASAEVFVTIDLVFVSVIMFACAQLEIIMAKTEQIQNVPYGIDLNDKNELTERNNHILKECISHHQAVLRFIKQVKIMFHVPIFVQLSGSATIICVLLFRISVETPNSMHFYSTLNYLSIMLSQLFLYCWCGNELTIRSEKLRDYFYFCAWYDHDKKFGQTLCFVMECLRRPLVFVAGHFIVLSRPTFVTILRCSYSYFAVLNQAQVN